MPCGIIFYKWSALKDRLSYRAHAYTVCIGRLIWFNVNKIDDELYLTIDMSDPGNYLSMFDMLNAWCKEADKFRCGDITKEEYDKWRYNYPRVKFEHLKKELNMRRAQQDGELIE